MGVIGDIFSGLDRWGIWRRWHEIPREVDTLNADVASLKGLRGQVEALQAEVDGLKQLVGGKRPGEVCPYCGAPAMRLQVQDMGGARENWRCEACGRTYEKRLDFAERG